jgi:hypothetical protein
VVTFQGPAADLAAGHLPGHGGKGLKEAELIATRHCWVSSRVLPRGRSSLRVRTVADAVRSLRGAVAARSRRGRSAATCRAVADQPRSKAPQQGRAAWSKFHGPGRFVQQALTGPAAASNEWS